MTRMSWRDTSRRRGRPRLDLSLLMAGSASLVGCLHAPVVQPISDVAPAIKIESGSDSSRAIPSDTREGIPLTFGVRWPIKGDRRALAMPPETKAVVFLIYRNDSLIQSVSVIRSPSSEPASRTVMLSPGDYLVRVRAYATDSPSSTSPIMASGAKSFTLQEGQGAATVSVDLEIAPSPFVSSLPSPNPTVQPSPSPLPNSSPVPSTSPVPYTTTLSVVKTLAGSGISGYADGDSASAKFNYPNGVATDGYGNVYVAEYGNNRIRKVDAAGNVSTYAGTGVSGYQDGATSSAKFCAPMGVAVDRDNMVYVADWGNQCIRMISPDGIVQTLAGGIGGFNDGVGAAARFNYPMGLALDGHGYLLVGDQYNNRIRKIDLASGRVTTVAGQSVAGSVDGSAGVATLNQPCSMAVAPDGFIYVSGAGHQIRRVSPTGDVVTVAGTGVAGFADGPAATAQFNGTGGLALGPGGELYIADHNNNRIRCLSPSGWVSTVAGTGAFGVLDGAASSALFAAPWGLAYDGHLYVADTNSNRIRVISP